MSTKRDWAAGKQGHILAVAMQLVCRIAHPALFLVLGFGLILVGHLSARTGPVVRQPLSPPLFPGPRHTRHTLAFQGSALAVEALAGPRWHTLWVEVDGKAANALPKDAKGRAYLNLYQPEKRTVRVTVARDLPTGNHTVTFVSGPGDPVWPITALIIGEPSPPITPLNLLGMALIVLGLMPVVEWCGPLIARWGQAKDGPPRVAILRLHALILALAAFTAPFAAWYVQGGGATIIATEVAISVAVGMCAITILFVRRPFPRLDHYKWRASLSLPRVAVSFAVAAALLSTVHAESTGTAWAAVKSRVGFPLLLGLLVWNSNLPTRKAIVTATTYGTALLALIALTDLLTGRAIWVAGLPRVRGPFGSPNHLALDLVRGLPFGLVLASQSWREGRGSKSWLHLGPVVLTGSALMLTASRGAWLLGVPGVVLSLWTSKGNRSRAGWTKKGTWTLLLAAGIGVILTLVRGTDTWQQRWLIWQGVLRMIWAHPWTGIGLGQFPTTYPVYALPTAWREPLLYHAHNTLLNTAAVVGIPAMLATGYLLLAILRQRVSDPLARAARASLVGGLAFGLVDAFWALPDLAYLTALAAALLMPPPSRADVATDHTPR